MEMEDLLEQTKLVKPTIAKYMIEVTLQYFPKRSNVNGNIVLFKKNGMYGNADEMLYLCPYTGCKGFTTETFEMTEAEKELMEKSGAQTIWEWPPAAKLRYDTWDKQLVTCPLCSRPAPRSDLADSWGVNTTLDRVAQNIADYFELLEQNADIMMIITRNPKGLQKAKQEFVTTKNTNLFSQDLEQARKTYHVFYPLINIQKDLSSGASVVKRVEALLKA